MPRKHVPLKIAPTRKTMSHGRGDDRKAGSRTRGAAGITEGLALRGRCVISDARSTQRASGRCAMELSFACSSMTSSKKKRSHSHFSFVSHWKRRRCLRFFYHGLFSCEELAELTVVYHAVRFRYFRVRFNFNRLLDSRALAFARAGYALTPVSRTPGYPSSRSRRVRSRRPSA